MQETWVQPLGPEDSPEEEMATHSGILCLENSRDRGAWWATVPGVTKSWTGLSNWARLYIPILARALTAHSITSPGWLKQKLLRDTWELTLLLRGPLPPPLQDTASAAHIYDPGPWIPGALSCCGSVPCCIQPPEQKTIPLESVY